MCGIAGYINLDGRDASEWIAMQMGATVAHRGPDGHGSWSAGPIAVSHQRLSIIDATSGGRQPMVAPGGRFVLVYNGELYNYRELRLELERAGVRFRSASDTEVVLHSLVEWGTAAIKRFNGMFALAFVDTLRESVLLARDRFGIKPLYVARTQDAVLFGSEVKALLAHPRLAPKIDEQALVEYLTFQNFFTQRTLFDGVELLPAGTAIEICGGTVKESRYWDFDFGGVDTAQSDESYLEELTHLFEQAVTRQLVSDVPVASYLSGGMDSGAITKVAAQHIPGMRTFTVGFDLRSASGLELAFDERATAEHMSYLFGTEHYQMVLKAGDMERCMRQLVWHLEEPRVGQSYPNYYAAGLAGRFGKVVLAGTGGDEIFAGYPWRYYQSMDVVGFDDYVDRAYAYWRRLVPDEYDTKLFRPDLGAADGSAGRDILSGVFEDRRRSSLESPADYLNRSLYLEAKTFLNGLLVVEDKLSMAHGLETRVPFLDNDLVEFAQRLPAHLRLHHPGHTGIPLDENEPGLKRRKYESDTGDGKILLRRMMASYVPESIAGGKKRGFSAPDASWFRGESIEYVRRTLIDGDAAIFSYLDPTTVRELVNDHLEGRRNLRLLLWSLLYLEEFLDIFISGGGDDVGR